MVWLKLGRAHLALELGIASVVAGAAFAQPYRLIVIQGISMSPTYENHTAHLVHRIDGRLYKGEVVVLNGPGGSMIKRIAHLPGESIQQINTGYGWVDASDMIVPPDLNKHDAYLSIRDYTIPEGQVYVLGDNRFKSVDSRDFGLIPVNQVWGTLVEQRVRVTPKKEHRTASR